MKNSIMILNLVHELEEIVKNLKKNINILKDPEQVYNETLKNEKTLLVYLFKLERFIIHSRNYFYYSSPDKEKALNTFDEEITKAYDFKISKEFFADYFVYKVNIPLIIPNGKHKISDDILKIIFNRAKKEYEKQNNVSIIPIGYPALIVVNKSKSSDKKYLAIKDVDNYQITPFINVFQHTFYGDDRNIVSLTQTNETGCERDETCIHILPGEKLVDYLSKIY